MESERKPTSSEAGWTINTLKEYFERVTAEQEKAVKAAFAAAEKAIEKSETAQTAYNARSNEFRAALDDQSKSLLPRTEATSRFDQLNEKIESQSKRISDLENFRSGVGGQSLARDKSGDTTKWLIGLAVAIALALAAYLFKH